jgi:hypothetical protein
LVGGAEVAVVVVADRERELEALPHRQCDLAVDGLDLALHLGEVRIERRLVDRLAGPLAGIELVALLAVVEADRGRHRPPGRRPNSPEMAPSTAVSFDSPAKSFAPSARAASRSEVAWAVCVWPGSSHGFTRPLASAVVNGAVYMKPRACTDSASLPDCDTPSL